MRVIIGCENSQTVANAFRAKGHEAYSCDILPAEGGHPEYHFQDDIFKVLKREGPFDLGIFHPPCTYVCSSGLHWNKRVPGRQEKTEQALQFIADLMNVGIPKTALENPIGCISTRISFNPNGGGYYVLPEPDKSKGRAPDQTIQPWQFGHAEQKATCLWLKNLPLLQPTKEAEFKFYRCKCGTVFEAELGKYGCCDGPAKILWDNLTPSGQNKLGPSADRWKIRSKTYDGIAAAMAEQWGTEQTKTTLF